MSWRRLFKLLRATVVAYVGHGGPLLGAALAFYTILSVAPLMLVVLACASWALVHAPGAQTPQNWQAVFSLPLDADTQAWVESLLDNLRQSQAQAGAGALGTLLLWYSGSRLFLQMQQAINQLWQLKSATTSVKAGVVATLYDQLLALLMIFIVGGALAMVVLSGSALGAMRGALGNQLPGGELMWTAGTLAVNFGTLGTLFALLLRILPAARLALADLAIGAAVTAILFALLEYPLSYYLGSQGIEGAFGAAGSLVVFLLWVYYSAQIFLFGAQFTWAWATLHGAGLTPVAGTTVMAASAAPAPSTSVPAASGQLATSPNQAGPEAARVGAAMQSPAKTDPPD